MNMFNDFVIGQFLSAVNNYTDKNAFCIAGKFYSYYDFAQHISKIRQKIQTIKGSSEIIGLIANDDIETYASIFAIWFEGLAYVPLHPKQPMERNLQIIKQADITWVINSQNNNPFEGLDVVFVGDLIFTELLLKPNLVDEDKLAYILFTSGSTGMPKGVQINRKNVGAFMKSFWETGFQVNESDKCLQCFDLTFDVSVQAFLTSLTKGACTYTIPHEQIKYSYIYGLLEDHHLTFCVMAPSMIRFLRPYFDEIHSESVKYCILTAEASPLELAMEWSACIPNAEVFNFYGPTEATIYCTYHKLKKEGKNKDLNGMLSIGKPMNGVNAIIVDENSNVLSVNQKGEMCISGDQITPGYWKNPQKNSESFFTKDYQGKTTRYYKTGDLCYFDEDGDIMLSGRLDYQVKIQGYRIELGEIEYHAREYMNGNNAVAVAYENKTGNNEIALFVESESCDTNLLLDYLKTKLPPYMVPVKTIVIEIFPLNANGKTDRLVLKNSIIKSA